MKVKVISEQISTIYTYCTIEIDTNDYPDLTCFRYPTDIEDIYLLDELRSMEDNEGMRMDETFDMDDFENSKFPNPSRVEVETDLKSVTEV